MTDNRTPWNASSYEEGMRKSMPYHETFHAETIDLIHYLYPKVQVWLDTGCGTGALIARAYPSFSRTKFLLADPSSAMLEVARGNLKDIPENQLEILGSVGTEQLPRRGQEKPQVITSILAHHYLNREQRSLATRICYDLLAIDGLYVTFENIYPLTEQGKENGLGRWQAYQQSHGKSEDEAKDAISRYNKAYFPISVEEHIAVLKNSGFSVAELFWFSHMQAGFYAVK